MIERAHRFHDVLAQRCDLERLAEEVEIEEGADVFFLGGLADGFGVEPADEELEGEVVGVGEAVGFAAGGGVGFAVVEAGAEKGGVVAEELLVEDPVVVFGADVDVYEGVGEEPGGRSGLVVGSGWWRRGLAGGDVYSFRGFSCRSGALSEVVDDILMVDGGD